MCLIPDFKPPKHYTLVAVDLVNNEIIIGFFHGVWNGYCHIRSESESNTIIEIKKIIRILDLTDVMKDDMYLQITLRSGKLIFSQIHDTPPDRTLWLLDKNGEMVWISLSNISDVAVLE